MYKIQIYFARNGGNNIYIYFTLICLSNSYKL